MNCSDPLNSMARAITRAVDTDLPDLVWEGRDGAEKRRRPHGDDMLVMQFPQMWGSTALGFGGVGGAAMTTSDTTVILCNGGAAVYFGGRKAYVISRINEVFQADVDNQSMCVVGKHGKYERKGGK